MSEPRTVEAPLTAVTVLEDRASVTRRGSFPVTVGQQRIVIDRVSPVLADKTLAATCTGARVLDVRCERYVAPWRDAADPRAYDVTALRADLTSIDAAREAALARASAGRAESEALGELASAAHRDLAIAAARGVTVNDAAAALAALDAQDTAARGRAIAADREAEDLAAQRERVASRLARAEAEAGEQAARLIVDLVAETAGEAAVTASYVVPGAAWRPYHRARLLRDTGSLEWQTTACIWQATGEDWSDVELTCSLERPSLGVEPPALVDDVLTVRKKPDSVVVETREQEQQDTGLGAAGPLQVPGIDDGGLGVSLVAGHASVRADGEPHRIPVGSFTAKADIALVAIPLKSPWVHVRAKSSNTGSVPVLAGPVDLIMASGYIGRAEIGFVAPGEAFQIGFGPESDVRVHRAEWRDRDDAGLLGGWNVATVRVTIRLSNLGARTRDVTVTERVPISEVEQVQVVTSAADAFLLDDDDQPGGERITQITARTIDDKGLVTWAVELPARARRAVTLEFKIKSQRGVAGV